MKKKITLVLVAILAITTLLVAGCAKGEKALPQLQKAYGNVSQAKKIEVNIEAKRNSLVQYTSQTVYTKMSDGYSWNKTTRTIQHIDDKLVEEMPEGFDGYETVTTTGLAEATTEFVPTLNLDAQYFNDYTAKAKSLTAEVKGGSEAAFLGLNSPLVPTPSDMVVNLTVAKKQATELVITFVSDKCNVTISFAFTY